jgi:hypothetical protein
VKVVIAHLHRSLPAALLCLALSACGASAQGTTSRTSASVAATPRSAAASTAAARAAEAPCAGAAPATAARAAGTVAERIYALELSSAEVQADRRQIESYAPLLSALAAGSRSAVAEAVTHLVYSRTHIVRLRVTHGATVLADVGGPYILAPISGNLRLRGRTLGRYVFSVQDDLGYVKLENRFIGYPLILRQGGRPIPLEGTIAPGAATIPDHGPVLYRRASYEAFSFNAHAFPSGALKVTMLVPTPRSSTAGCAAVTVSELSRVAQTVWHRFTVLRAPVSSYIRTLHGLTDGLIYVRAGSRQLAGSTQPGPPQLPAEGTVRYRRTAYRVTSFAATTAGAAVRVYQLIAA